MTSSDVPEQKHITVHVQLTEEQKKALKKVKEEEDWSVGSSCSNANNWKRSTVGKKVERVSDKEDRMVKDTQLFKTEKIDYILERAEEFPKLFIFAAYTA